MENKNTAIHIDIEEPRIEQLSNQTSQVISTFDKWYLNTHFELIEGSIKYNKFTVKCLLCLPKLNLSSESTSVTSNLYKHLRCVHALILKTSPKRIYNEVNQSLSDVKFENFLLLKFNSQL